MYKEVREKLNLTVDEMSEHIGVETSIIEKWESGDENPSEQIKSIFLRLNSKLQILEKIKNAAGKLKINSDFSGYIAELKDEMGKHQINIPQSHHDEILIDHLEFSIDEFIRKNNLSDLDIKKDKLALHIYNNIKFLF